MTKDYLYKILTNVTDLKITDVFFDSLFEPCYEKHPIDEYRLNTYLKPALSFDYKANGFEFISGKIACTGLTFEFKHERFPKIRVSVMYDSFRKKVFNYVLCMPTYTENDRTNKNGVITQKGRKINNNSDLKRYVNDLYKKFDCPLSIQNTATGGFLA